MPAAVVQAQRLARDLGFTASCRPEVGRLLRLLAAQVTVGAVAEIGTGTGVGTAWLAAGLRDGVRLITIDNDAGRAQAARALFASHHNVEVQTGDWRDLPAHGPFALVFVDVGEAKAQGDEVLADAVAPGGLVVMDDFTPEHLWTEAQRALWKDGDPVRTRWLQNPRFTTVEVLAAPDHAVILAVRR